MPFVNIQLIAGPSQEKKSEMARRVVDAVSELGGLPKEAVWVVFEEVSAADWFVGASSVEEIRKKRQSS